MDRRSFLKFIPYVAALALPIKAIATPRSNIPNLPVDDNERKTSHFYTDTTSTEVYKWDEPNKEWILV